MITKHVVWIFWTLLTFLFTFHFNTIYYESNFHFINVVASSPAPSRSPTALPSNAPVTPVPTRVPSRNPTRTPSTRSPTKAPTVSTAPTKSPSINSGVTDPPTLRPTSKPSTKKQEMTQEMQVVFGVVGGVIGFGLSLLLGCGFRNYRIKRNFERRAELFRSMDLRLAQERKGETSPPERPSNLSEIPKGATSAKQKLNDNENDEGGDSYDMNSINVVPSQSSSATKPKKDVEEMSSRPFSVRDFVAQNPNAAIIKPNQKALKMLGATEGETKFRFDGNVNQRMAKIALDSGAGNYTTGMATKNLGGDIIKGFDERREKLEKKQAERERKKAEEEKKKLETQKNSPTVGIDESQPARISMPKGLPGPKKFAEFLSKVPGNRNSTPKSVASGTNGSDHVQVAVMADIQQQPAISSTSSINQAPTKAASSSDSSSSNAPEKKKDDAFKEDIGHLL